MNEHHYAKYDETIYDQKLDNGLLVQVLPKRNFHKTYAILTVDFGSIDRTFIPVNGQELITVPDGVAHFLEHKMFEKIDHDAFDLFGELGADSNAFTSFTQTSYLFSTTQHVHESLDVLLDFVEQPYFSSQTVQKEKGIIGQEIKMYDDDPNWRLYFGMLGNLYPHDPMHIDIAGTVESIDQITADTLYSTYDSFYQPANMNLFIVGNVDPAETMEWIADNQKQKHFDQVTIPEVQFELNDETGQDVIPFRTLEMDVTRPKVMVGVRGLEPISAGQAGLKYRLGVELLLDILFDDTVDNYLRLYNNGIIDDSFSYNFEMQRGFHFAYFSSDTDHIERFADEIIGILESAQQQIEAAASQFNNIKRAVLGRMIALLDSPEAIANRYAGKLFGATNLLDEITVLESITIEDLYVIAREFIQSQGISVYQIVPRHSN
ncbi:M16 family peptidase [Paucilactobacillus vaccinostercus DSM 20634]|jgi:predicted Zn-dependent peptidase|uniref:M16 family peptidase n=1 Tax=Paucilactobacillus vaccinostercus DSM 20634 TaxID=1423813 RepID=A0A0R2ACX5_9LACO|nr:pitrilysin family protein [Paucilactobacillus vaccinostercus]KRM60604.1 M16 family peptidase [Paucilactobacillus vaccinostercus DSM 20634]